MFIKCSQHLLQYGDSIDAFAAAVWCYSSLMKWRKIQHFTFDCSLLHNVWKPLSKKSDVEVWTGKQREDEAA